MTSILEQTLTYYQREDNPGYAVLVTGPWGVGKTFQVRSYLEQCQYWYISLFGRTSTNEIHDAVLAQIFPIAPISPSKLGVINVIGRSVLKTKDLGTTLNGVIRATLQGRIKPERTLIFDDLERCELPIKDLLGTLNHYIEHYGFRVILICDDSRMSEHFPEMKEKIIGRIIRVTPQVNSAFGAFVQEISSPKAMKYLAEYEHEIVSTFNTSGVHSLRILRQSCRDLAHLFQVLSEKHMENKSAIRELVTLFIAMDIGVRANKIFEKDMRNRADKRFSNEFYKTSDNYPDHKEARLVQFEKQYPTVRFESDLFNEDVLVQMFIFGIYDQHEIHESLERSVHYMEPRRLRPWRVVISFSELPDEVVEQALADMLAQLKRYDVVEPGEILHVFSLLMLMATNGTLEKEVGTLVKEAKLYIESLLEEGKLSPWAFDDDDQGGLRESFGGHGYWIRAEYQDEFEEVYSCLLGARREALGRCLPVWGGELAMLVRDDAQSFFQLLVNSHDGERPYSRVPVLREIDEGAFVEAWLSGPIEGRHWIRWALERRYEGTMGGRLLDQESAWAASVCRLMENKALELCGFRGMRVKRLVPRIPREVSVCDG